MRNVYLVPSRPPAKLGKKRWGGEEKQNDFPFLIGFVRVLENLESPGTLLWHAHFPGLESPGKRLPDLPTPITSKSAGFEKKPR